jgi:hypothetical protein
MRFVTAFAIVCLLAGCMTTEHAQTSQQSVRATKAQALKQQQTGRALVLGLAY